MRHTWNLISDDYINPKQIYFKFTKKKNEGNHISNLFFKEKQFQTDLVNKI